MPVPESQSRRSNVRAEMPVIHRVYCRVDDVRFAGRVIDLSFTGAALVFEGETQPRVAWNDQIALMFGYDDQTKNRGFQGLTLEGEIRWIRADDRGCTIGFKLPDLRQEERKQLAQYIEELIEAQQIPA